MITKRLSAARAAAPLSAAPHAAASRAAQHAHRSTAPESVPIAGAPSAALTLGVALRSSVASAPAAAAARGRR